ncbi:MAG: metal-dependent hydrolase, partial [Planctomycetota bacterium]
MDPLTHALAGAALGRAAARPLSGRPLALLVLLSLAPDADIVLSWISDVVYLKYHRGVTHSLLMLPLWIWLAHAL